MATKFSLTSVGKPPVGATRVYLGLVAFSILGSGLQRATGLDPGPIAPIAGALTLLAGFWAVFGGAFSGRLAVTMLVGASSEIVGLGTGWPFGRYVYTDAWWPTVSTPWGPYPVLLPIAWATIAGGAAYAFPGRPVLAALLATGVDLVMEPVMAGPLGYWRWLDGGPLPGNVPLTNALGWFGVSLAAALILRPQSAERRPVALWVLSGHLVLTLALGALRS